VIVNSASSDLDLRSGEISSALLAAAGQGLQEECKKRFPCGIKPDIIAVTDGYALKCKAVFHITLQLERSSECSIVVCSQTS
jgi:O-acetyl-ADP-ribose deacetylase (regulator of RNase III)